jgi:hypothetical protein
MRFKQEVGIITLVQFITMCMLGIVNGLYSIIATCIKHDECISNAIVSIIYFLLLAVWFGFLWILGYSAQERRSKRLFQALIMAEGLVALVSLFNAKHHPDFLGLFTSLVDFVLAVWIIILAWRLMRAGPGRATPSSRRRVRSQAKVRK